MNELVRRYNELLEISRRIVKSYYKEGWEDGENIEDVLYEIKSFSDYEDLEKEIFKQSIVPVSKRANGRMLPDLTKLPHVCEFQSNIKLLD